MTLTATDLFCGAGGSSLGAEVAGVTLRLGLNHWRRAIETHAANFQHADHDCEDIASLTTAQIRRYPDSDILLASPECTNHSLAKGARRRKPQAASLFDDGPAGDDEQDRSRATMWDVVRFAEQKLIKGHPYKAVIVENVVDAYRWGYGDDGGLFRAWLMAMEALGYRHEIVWLNSMFCPPTPQSRDRMYVVFWLKGMRAPDLRVEPPSWCPHCERVVEGRQTWKRVDRAAWGRYGAQYFYSCPDCNRTVIPGAHPAASVIDHSITAQKIGERARPLAKNTRERIRRGLERLASEPFAIRSNGRGTPKPLTLPITIVPQRRNLAMFLPPMGGAEPRHAGENPLATQTTTTSFAVILPVGGNVHEARPGNRARDGEVQPLATITASDRSALVYANRANGMARSADEAPAQSVLTGGHLAVIMANYSPGWTRRAGESPVGSITTQDGHSIVVPYHTLDNAVIAAREPGRTVDTRDRFALVVPPVTSDEVYESVAVTEDEIDECAFRMFTLSEIAGAMAMDLHHTGDPYVVTGTKREQMAQYGNAVTPPAMELLVGRVARIFDEVSA